MIDPKTGKLKGDSSTRIYSGRGRGNYDNIFGKKEVQKKGQEPGVFHPVPAPVGRCNS